MAGTGVECPVISCRPRYFPATPAEHVTIWITGTLQVNPTPYIRYAEGPSIRISKPLPKFNIMFRNFLKIAWRNLVRNKIYSVINIVGLATGLACFLLISMYVLDELSFDRFYPHSDRIYRLNADIRFGGGDLHMPFTSDMMGQVLKKDYPQVEEYARLFASSGPKLIKKGNDYITEEHVTHADSTFFRIFIVPSISGDLKNALNDPNTVVITETAAKKYFGTTDALGKTLEIQDRKKTPYKVTAVIKDIPKNSHFQFDFYFSMKNVDYTWGQFLSHNFHTYLLLKEGTDPKDFEKNFVQYIDKYCLPEARQFMQINTMDDFRKAGNKLEYSMIPVRRIHLFSDRQYEFLPSGNIQYVYIFSAVALLILLIACINFMNLTTARSANRAREVGIRKVLGTERKELITQFLTESILMTVLSMTIAIGLDWLVLPLFNQVSGKSITMSYFLSPAVLPLVIGLPLLVGLLAGSYPAFFLSAFQPIEVLKGKLKLGSKSGGLRSLLVVFQFATSIMLIIGTIVIYKQLNYIQSKDLGYKKDQVLVIDGLYSLGDNDLPFKNKVLGFSGVEMGTISSFLPVTQSSRTDQTFSKEAVMDSKNGIDMQTWYIDYDYLNTMGMKMARGRNFSRDFGSDSSAVIINETTASFLGYSDPVGQKIYTINGENKTESYNIIGVVRNFNFETLHQNIGPLSFFLGKKGSIASFKVKTAKIKDLVAQVESLWKSLAPGMPFSYRFMDDSFNEMYRSEQRVGQIALTFAVLAILIACLGLFGLATFIAEQRTKEIGIRKVLGASVRGIVQLLSRDFMKLVAIAFVIAAPISWWAMHSWLSDFAYRIRIEWWIFALAAILALLIALITVSFQAIKAAITNPVKSLRTE
jgi:putative ABC transport system permease protein